MTKNEEWKPVGNNFPDSFQGEKTPRLQSHVDRIAGREQLRENLTADCRNCEHASMCMDLIVQKVIQLEVSTTDATGEMARRFGVCTGPVYNPGIADGRPGCPIERAERKPRHF